MSYGLCVGLGILLAALARRGSTEPPLPHRHALALIAVIGAISGAFLFEIPPDQYGWTASSDLQPAMAHTLGGRTVLGGLLGGWIAVEAGKWGLGIRQPTGDAFALPLALALACGRLGCFLNGCCAGRRLRPNDAWAPIALLGHDGHPRFPAQLCEVAFHLTAAGAIVLLARKGMLSGRRFAVYVALYAAFRFGIEFVRDNPPVALGLSYYQFLALPLFLLASATLTLRSWRAREMPLGGALRDPG